MWAATLLAALAELALTVVAWDDLKPSDGITSLYGPVAAVAYATLGALIVRRAGNLIGWIMLGAGAAQAFLAIASAYAVIGVATFPGSLPAAKQVGTLAECSFPAVVFTIAFMFLLFPTGTLPSRRWRPVAAAGLVLAVPDHGRPGRARRGWCTLPAPGGASLSYPNPLAVEHLRPGLAHGPGRHPERAVGGVRRRSWRPRSCRSPSGTGLAAGCCGSRSNGSR